MKIFRTAVIFIFLSQLFLTNVYALNSTICRPIDQTNIELAIKNYLNTTQSIRYDQITISSKNCYQDYARATLQPKNHMTDNAVVYLKIINNNWQIIALGTSFEPDFMKKIPPQLK